MPYNYCLSWFPSSLNTYIYINALAMHWQSSVSSIATVKPMARLSYIVLIIATNALICVLAEELYPNRYDHLDVRALLQNDTLREDYYKCFMELAPCTTLAQQRLTGIAI
ncbi:uncharacterized protein LOC112467241, partial [Temnothorax curvispinosus]|uniref:Uncharacterized protein LOC112467241 n=1 Tax=Temnothorax curvispinosus TaxID=300111 RepID=A0A6J1RBB3_9HYME